MKQEGAIVLFIKLAMRVNKGIDDLSFWHEYSSINIYE